MSRRVARKRSKIASRPRYSCATGAEPGTRQTASSAITSTRERSRVAPGEGGEDPVDALEGVYVSSGAIVRPLASSWEW